MNQISKLKPGQFFKLSQHTSTATHTTARFLKRGFSSGKPTPTATHAKNKKWSSRFFTGSLKLLKGYYKYLSVVSVVGITCSLGPRLAFEYTKEEGEELTPEHGWMYDVQFFGDGISYFLIPLWLLPLTPVLLPVLMADQFFEDIK